MPAQPPILAAFVAYRYSRGAAVPSLVRAVSAVQYEHTRHGEPPPTGPAVKLTMKGIRRDAALAGKRPRGKAPALAQDLRRVVQTMGGTLIDLRDKALLLLGFAGAFRRSELVALNVADVVEVKEGYRVHVRRSKTDQAGEGMVKGIPFGESPDTCPVGALAAWLRAAGITEGPLFVGVNRHGRRTEHRLSGADVGRVVKKLMARIGKDVADFGGHSLRAGLVTEAYAAGKSTKAIMDQTGHKSLQTLHRYIRLAELFRDNAARGIGL